MEALGSLFSFFSNSRSKEEEEDEEDEDLSRPELLLSYQQYRLIFDNYCKENNGPNLGPSMYASDEVTIVMWIPVQHPIWFLLAIETKPLYSIRTKYGNMDVFLASDVEHVLNTPEKN